MEPTRFALLQEEVRAFVDGSARELSRTIEDTGSCGPAVWSILRERGLLRLAAPEEYGGQGLTFTQYLRLLEIVSESHASLRMIVHVTNGIWRPLDFRASPEQRENFVKPLVRGEKIVAFTLTEPGAGSGADIGTTVRRDGDEYIVNGDKWLITFADVANDFLTFCRLEGTMGSEGTVALLIPRAAAGLQIRMMPPSMGLSGTGHGHLHMRECRVPVANRLGEEGEGLAIALRGFLEPSRIGIGMTCVGLAKRALDLARQRADRRMTFGKYLSQRQIVQMWIAEMATDIEAARQLVHYAATEWERTRAATKEAAMAKLFGLEMLQRVTDKAMQIYGGIGYFRESEIERIYRDARAQRFEEGTAEIQKATIFRALTAG